MEIDQTKISQKISHQKYRNSLRGNLTKLLSDAKKDATRRCAIKGRKEMGDFTLTKEQLLIIYQYQNGLCFYWVTKKMSLIKGDKYSMSLERIDPSKNYTQENVVLCCEEFNGSRQWTKEKIEKCKQIFNGISKQQEYNEDTFKENMKKKPFIMGEDCRDATHIKNEKSGRCKNCLQLYDAQRRRDPRGFLLQILKSCRSSCKSRQKTRPNEIHECTLSFGELCSMYMEQQGKCYISSINMLLIGSVDFQLSIERLDNSKGYMRENCVLICLEFNTTKQWTREMYIEWMRSLNQVNE